MSGAARGRSAPFIAIAAVAIVVVALVAGWLGGQWWGTRHLRALGTLGLASPGAVADDSPVVATVGDERLTLRQLEHRWNDVLGASERAQLRQRGGLSTYLDEVVEELLLAQEAQRRGLLADPATREAVRSAANHVVTRRLLLAEVREKVFPESELRALYERRRDEWGEPLRVRVREILVRAGDPGAVAPLPADDPAWEGALAAARALRARLEAGEDFAALAREHSDSPTARYGGEVGWVVAGRFFAEYEGAALGLAQGELSQPVRTARGWVLLQAEERQDEQVPPFDEKRSELLDALIRDDPGAPARRYRLFVEELRRETPVVVREELLAQVEDRERPAG